MVRGCTLRYIGRGATWLAAALLGAGLVALGAGGGPAMAAPRGSAAASGTAAAGPSATGASGRAVAARHLAARAASAAPAARTVVTFTWGGGISNQMAALPLFRQFRMPATFYIPSGLVCVASTDPGCGRSPYLTVSDIRQIAADGNEIGGLGLLQQPLTGIPAAEAQRQICDDRVNLTGWGFQVSDFAYPFAQVNPELEGLVQRCGYNTGLGTGQLRGAGLCPSCAWAESIPPRDPDQLRAPIEVASVGTTWSPATFESIVTGAQQHGGGWIIFTIHDVCASACALGVTKPELSSVLAWLAGQASHGVSVQTVRQVIAEPVRPLVHGPAPRPIPGAGVANARLSAVGHAGSPACFQTAGYGANTAAFSYHPNGGPGGAGAETIRMTKWRSGNAKLLPTMDLGNCAPSVTAGRSYTIGAWYRASRAVHFDVYYRTAIGNWVYGTSSPQIAASAGWTHATWTPPPVPAGMTAVSFGVAIGTVGTLTTTQYTLVPVRNSAFRLITFGVLVLAFLFVVGTTRRLRRRDRPPAGTGEPRPSAGSAAGRPRRGL